MSATSEEKPAVKPEVTTVARVRKCLFKGCKKTSLDCKIVNHACPKHHAVMKAKNSKQRKANYNKHRKLKQCGLNFAILKDFANLNVYRELRFEVDVVRNAAMFKGFLLGISEDKRHFEALQEYGVCFINTAVKIGEKELKEFKELVSKNESKFERLFTGLTAKNGPKFRNAKVPNRFVMNTSDIEEELARWNNIINKMRSIKDEIDFPVKGKEKADVSFSMSILKTQASCEEPQVLHTDEFEPFSFGNKSDEFGINSVTAITDCFIWVHPFQGNLNLLYLQTGDTVLIRTDIPHAGGENLTNNDTYRIHTFWYINQWNVALKDGFTNKKVAMAKQPSIKWHEKKQKYYMDE